jgi:hypothetical protein
MIINFFLLFQQKEFIEKKSNRFEIFISKIKKK